MPNLELGNSIQSTEVLVTAFFFLRMFLGSEAGKEKIHSSVAAEKANLEAGICLI